MKLRGLIAGVIALALSTTLALAQAGTGTSSWAIEEGGTGASTASGARTNLGVAIGTNVQAWDADLDALAALSGTDTIYRRSGTATWSAVTIGGLLSFSSGTLNVGDAELTALAGLTSAADKCAYFTGSGTAALTDCPSFGRSLMNAADASTARTTLGVVIGTDVQAYDAELAAIAGLTSAADKCFYFTGSATSSTYDCSSFGRTLANSSDAPAARTSLGLGTAATQNTGTSGANVPLLNGNNTTSGDNSHSGTEDFQAPVKLSSFVTSTQITANQNDYTATDGSNTCSTKQTEKVSSDASRKITGLSCGQSEGSIRIIHNVGSNDIVLTNQDAASTAANRFLFGGDITLGGDTSITIRYDGVAERWRPITTPGAGGGGGGVTSVTIAAGDGQSVSGTCTITTSGTCTVTGYVAPPQGRLTLQTGVPVMTSTQSAKTTIYYTAHVGNQIPIYDGTRMVPTVITGGEISVATTDTTKSPAAIGASKVNDWFVWNDSGTIRLSHGPDWTNDTTRSAGTALTKVNGIYLNNASITNGPAASRGTYVGTTRSNSSSQLDWIYGGSGTAAFFGVWNAYNRVTVGSIGNEGTTSWSYTSITVRALNNSALARASFVRGLDEDAVSVVANIFIDTNTSTTMQVGLGLDSTSSNVRVMQATAPGVAGIGMAQWGGLPGLGFHFIQQNENSNGTNSYTAYGGSTLSSFRFEGRF